MGAGASYELGLPLVDELTIEFKKALFRNRKERYYNVPNEIESVIIPLLNNNKLTYEDIIGRIEIEIRRCHNNVLYQKWYGILGRYLEAIFYLLLERHYNNKIYINAHLHFLEPLINYCDKYPLWIFSLNHDLLIELIGKYFNIPIKSGFYETISIAGYTFEKLSRENMEKNKFSFFHNEGGINLVKLHGALDVFVQGDEKNYLKIINEGSNAIGIIDNVKNLLESDASSEDGVRCTNEITYYDDNHILQFLRMTIMSGKHKYSSHVSHVMDDWFFKIYKGHINYVKKLFSIGYSFQDLHVNGVLYDWLSFSGERKLVIVNPYLKSIPNFLRHLEGQIKILNLTFFEFLNQDILNKLRWAKINNYLRNYNRNKFLRSNILR